MYSTRYVHVSAGTELTTAGGTACYTFSGSSDGSYYGVGLIFSLLPASPLASERWLFRERNLRVTVLPSGDLRAVFSYGGDNVNQVMTYALADLQAAGWALSKPQFLYCDAERAVGSPGSTPNDPTTGYTLNVYLNGVRLLEATRSPSGNNPSRYPAAIGGSDGEVFSDLIVYEYFVHTALQGGQLAGLTPAQVRLLHNDGHGAGPQLFSFLGPRLVYLVRFDAQHYNPATNQYTPVVARGIGGAGVPASGPAKLYSIAYFPEYAQTDRLYFDGLTPPNSPQRLSSGDRVDLASGVNHFPGLYTRTTLDSFTYEFWVRPEKSLGYSGVTQGSFTQMVTFNVSDAPTYVADHYSAAQYLYQLMTFCYVGTDGIIFGVNAAATFGSPTSYIMLAAYFALPRSVWTRIAIRVVNRKAYLYVNGALYTTGADWPADYTPGTVDPTTGLYREWDIHATLNLAEPGYGYAGNRGGSFGGFVRHYSLWSAPRAEARIGTLPDPAEADYPSLELYWTMGRTSPQSTTLLDASGNGRNGLLVNYVLDVPAISSHLRLGRLLR